MQRKTDGNYEYPIIEDWTRTELIDVTKFFSSVEMAYYDDHGVNREQLLDSYAKFQKINPARTEQNSLRREFETNSGLDIYHLLKKAQENPNLKRIKGD
ncbi:UPF0223 family protein [Fructilactobacillus vespulae]|uniref:UPF0223 family protein n=1 Tax=Fructilactobacillus vespulae TaxID=1249630 RepID=UPI0039B3BFCA